MPEGGLSFFVLVEDIRGTSSSLLLFTMEQVASGLLLLARGSLGLLHLLSSHVPNRLKAWTSLPSSTVFFFFFFSAVARIQYNNIQKARVRSFDHSQLIQSIQSQAWALFVTEDPTGFFSPPSPQPP